MRSKVGQGEGEWEGGGWAFTVVGYLRAGGM